MLLGWSEKAEVSSTMAVNDKEEKSTQKVKHL